MGEPIFGRTLKPEKFKRLCDLQAPGHNRIIQPGKAAVRITSGDAQGLYHGRRCYEIALKQYRELKNKTGLK